MDRRHRASMLPDRARMRQNALTKITQYLPTRGREKRLKTADKNQRASYRLPLPQWARQWESLPLSASLKRKARTMPG